MHLKLAASRQSGKILHALAWCTTSVRRLQAMAEQVMLVSSITVALCSRCMYSGWQLLLQLATRQQTSL